jgi:nicotinamidase/pyrazinamidase
MLKINKATDALIIVDFQNDFCPGGAIAIPDGDKVVPVINQLIDNFAVVFAIQDWHPANHISFKTYGGPWPPHCIANTEGAKLHPQLKTEKLNHIYKGTKFNLESYSGFQGTNLKRLLRKAGITRVFIAGLGTEYCVRATALDALADKFEAVVIVDAVKGFEFTPGDSKKALAEIKKAGVFICESKEICG